MYASRSQPKLNAEMGLIAISISSLVNARCLCRRDGSCWDDGWGRLRRPGALHGMWRGSLRRPAVLFPLRRPILPHSYYLKVNPQYRA